MSQVSHNQPNVQPSTFPLAMPAADGTMLYMGKDKFENEDLIKYGWPEDIWFHVDNLSSAHVYVRMQPVSANATYAIPCRTVPWKHLLLPQALLGSCVHHRDRAGVAPLSVPPAGVRS
jgi:hypothetical protein